MKQTEKALNDTHFSHVKLLQGSSFGSMRESSIHSFDRQGITISSSAIEMLK